MTDIAHQTVEFLYDESGSLPSELNLPTIDDIREELARFTIERVKKGTSVVIRIPSQGGTALPSGAVRSMVRTFGLTGQVVEVDQVCCGAMG